MSPNGHAGPVKGVVFDFDGTLVDSYPLIERAFAAVMLAHHLDEEARQLFRESRGLPLPEQMKRISPHLWEDLVQTYRQADAALGHAQVFRGIPTVVRRLRQAGVRLGVVSCKRHLLVDAELEATRLRSAFDVVIGFEDVTPTKPAPDPLLHAIDQLELNRDATLYVGDTMVDLETGRAAQVRTVLAAWGLTPELRAAFAHHPLWATRPSEMLQLVLPTSPNGNGHKAA
ncbi:MAG TPA: HAD-IA family hydrolase [Candidatus Limnocylindrales bacterium]|nr:HAD-IA family hydrolase [Candidatus Limnocylindrales bacterium]